jgi:hypothetical protein
VRTFLVSFVTVVENLLFVTLTLSCYSYLEVNKLRLRRNIPARLKKPTSPEPHDHRAPQGQPDSKTDALGYEAARKYDPSFSFGLH